MTTVAIIGTGKMGGVMVRRLAAGGFDLTLWNRTAWRRWKGGELLILAGDPAVP